MIKFNVSSQVLLISVLNSALRFRLVLNEHGNVNKLLFSIRFNAN